jgi:DnaJ-class molecular chaperone
MGDKVMVVCDACGGDGHFDRVVGHDPNGPVWSDSFCTACQGAGEYAVKRESITLEDLDEISR